MEIYKSNGMKQPANASDISVAMATYNGQRFIRAQLDSLASQTLLPKELVITDDGSTDQTLAIIEDFAASAPFDVRVYRNEARLGYADNFFKAATLCTGGWISFCDQDDFWLPEKLARCVEELKRENAVMLAHSLYVGDENLIKTGGFYPAKLNPGIYAPMTLLPWRVFNGLSIVFSRSLIEIVDFNRRPTDTFAPNMPLAHDGWIYFIAGVLGTIIVIDEPLAIYRQHSANTCGTGETKSFSQRVSGSTERTEQHYLFLADIAHQRADTLRTNAEAAPHPFLDRLVVGAHYYERLNHWYTLRAGIHSQRRPWGRRLGALFELVQDGGYRANKNGGIGLAPFLKDFTLGLRPSRTILK